MNAQIKCSLDFLDCVSASYAAARVSGATDIESKHILQGAKLIRSEEINEVFRNYGIVIAPLDERAGSEHSSKSSLSFAPRVHQLLRASIKSAIQSQKVLTTKVLLATTVCECPELFRLDREQQEQCCSKFLENGTFRQYQELTTSEDKSRVRSMYEREVQGWKVRAAMAKRKNNSHLELRAEGFVCFYSFLASEILV